MQVVIEIPEAAYTACKAVKNVEDDGSNPLMSCLIDVVARGTVLPEKHGDLVDRDALWDAYHDLEYDFYEAYDNAPTILEAREDGEE